MKNGRIAIIADMEGITGVDTPGDCFPHTAGYWESSVNMMAADVNAIAAGLWEGSEGINIRVIDAHFTGQNLEHAKLNSKIELINYFDLTNCDAVVLCGHHSKAATVDGFLSHTLYPHLRVRINGEDVGELRLYQWLAGIKNIPVIMLTGDNIAIREASDFMPQVQSLSVKMSQGRASAVSYSLDAMRRLLREGAREALGRIDGFQAVSPPKRVNLEISIWKREEAELISKMRGAQRMWVRTIRFPKIRNFNDAFRTIFDSMGVVMDFWGESMVDRSIAYSSWRGVNSKWLKDFTEEWLTEPADDWYK